MDLEYSRRTLVAKKEHVCDRCDRTISQGDVYIRVFGMWDFEDKPIPRKFCSRCETPDLPGVKPDGYDYIREHYKVPVVVGQAVECDGRKGTVVPCGPAGHYLWVCPEGKRKREPWHPTWETVYYNLDGTLAADYRKPAVVTA